MATIERADKYGKQWVVGQDHSVQNLIEEKPLPSVKDMARYLAEAGKAAALSGMKLAPEEEQAKRYMICTKDCEWYRPSDDRCAKCGCYLAYKTKLAEWHCPIKRW